MLWYCSLLNWCNFPKLFGGSLDKPKAVRWTTCPQEEQPRVQRHHWLCQEDGGPTWCQRRVDVSEAFADGSMVTCLRTYCMYNRASPCIYIYIYTHVYIQMYDVRWSPWIICDAINCGCRTLPWSWSEDHWRWLSADVQVGEKLEVNAVRRRSERFLLPFCKFSPIYTIYIYIYEQPQYHPQWCVKELLEDTRAHTHTRQLRELLYVACSVACCRQSFWTAAPL